MPAFRGKAHIVPTFRNPDQLAGSVLTFHNSIKAAQTIEPYWNEDCFIVRREDEMQLATYKKFKGSRLMPWGKGTVVTGAKGYLFLAGNTGTAENYDPSNIKGGEPTSPQRPAHPGSTCSCLVKFFSAQSLCIGSGIRAC